MNTVFDEKLRDFLFEIRGPINTTNQVTIIDIDEKSIMEFGQWPFNRITIAQVLDNLTNANAGIIGLDIVFSDKDRQSPANMASDLGVKGDFIDSDKLLADVLSQTPTILGYYFSNTQKRNSFIPVSTQFSQEHTKHVIDFKYAVGNIELLSKKAYSSGFFNAFNNQNGKITKLPLILQYQKKIYPSLGLEMLSNASKTKKIHIHQDDYAINYLEMGETIIPTDKNGFMRINFRGPKYTFKYISFLDVFNGNFNPQNVSNKFVLIGTSVTGLADLRSTTYDLSMPGVEIHANLIDNILTGDFLSEPFYIEIIDICIIFILTFAFGRLLLYLRSFYIIITTSIVIVSTYILLFYLLFEFGIVLNLFNPLIAILLTSFVTIYLSYIKEKEQKELIIDKFAKKVSKEVANDLLKSNSKDFQVQEQEVTLFFSDIRDFTRISEQLDSTDKIISLLNAYLEPMIENIIEKEGTVDKFIGDSIMAYWNAPKKTINHADKAIISALEQLEILKKLNQYIKKEYNIILNIGIGIHSGSALIGEIGSKGRSDYTAIGNNVNSASRIEGLTKFFGSKILISEDTKQLTKEEYNLRFIATVIMFGKTKPMEIYEVMTEQQSNLFQVHCEEYEQALEYFYNKNFTEALNLFTNLFNKSPEKLYEVYINKSKKFLNNPCSSENVYFVFDTK